MRINPKHINQPRYYFTKHEGGRWILVMPGKLSFLDIKRICVDRDNWIIGKMKEDNCTPSGIIDLGGLTHYKKLTFHSLLFPDGKIWDSTLRCFCSYYKLSTILCKGAQELI
jgi:hypothetical protein